MEMVCWHGYIFCENEYVYDHIIYMPPTFLAVP